MQLQQIIPYTDIIIGNETEAEAWASATGLPHKDLASIAKALATQPKANPARPRVVVITHGAESTTVVSADDPENAKVFAVHALGDSEIVDTNGAGDAFAGGFLGAYVAGKSLEECVDAGHKMGAMCVQLVCLPSLSCRSDHSHPFPFSSYRSAPSTSGPRSRFCKLVLAV